MTDYECRKDGTASIMLAKGQGPGLEDVAEGGALADAIDCFLEQDAYHAGDTLAFTAADGRPKKITKIEVRAVRRNASVSESVEKTWMASSGDLEAYRPGWFFLDVSDIRVDGTRPPELGITRIVEIKNPDPMKPNYRTVEIR